MEEPKIEIKIDHILLNNHFVAEDNGFFPNERLLIPQELYNKFDLLFFNGSEFSKKYKLNSRRVKPIKYTIRSDGINNIIAIALFYKEQISAIINNFKESYNPYNDIIQTKKDIDKIKMKLPKIRNDSKFEYCKIEISNPMTTISLRSRFILVGILNYIGKWAKMQSDFEIKIGNQVTNTNREELDETQKGYLDMDSEFKEYLNKIGEGKLTYSNSAIRTYTFELLDYLLSYNVIQEHIPEYYLECIADIYTLIELPEFPSRNGSGKLIWKFNDRNYKKIIQTRRIRSILDKFFETRLELKKYTTANQFILDKISML